MTGHPSHSSNAPFARAPAPDAGRWTSRAPIASSFAVRADALRVLEVHRRQMQRSAALLDRALALFGRITATQAPAGRAAGRGAGCTIPGCPLPPVHRPIFAIDRADTRVLVRGLPLRVCAEHRALLAAMFRREAVLASLARKLRARGRGAPDSVRVLFEVA